MTSSAPPEVMTWMMSTPILNILNQVRQHQITPRVAVIMITRTGAFDIDEAREMVESMTDPNAGLTDLIVGPVSPVEKAAASA